MWIYKLYGRWRSGVRLAPGLLNLLKVFDVQFC
jgi:hypothetical protein